MPVDWLEGLEEEVPTSGLKAKAEIVPKARPGLTSREEQEEVLRDVESELYTEVMAAVAGVSAFGQLDPENIDEIPQAWIDELGEEQATIKHRHAKVGWMNRKEAPVGVTVATNTFVGIAKARAAEKGAPRSLNLIQVSMPGPPRTYDTVELDDSLVIRSKQTSGSGD